MTQRLAGKTAFVTAAGQGIGRATAEAFAREGAQVIATDLNESLLASFKGTPGVTTRRLDVLDPAAIATAAKDAGAVDILFNGAGFVHAGSVLECSEEEWAFAFDLNVRSQFRTIKAFVPGMLAKGRGSIINIASVAGSIKGAPNRFVYGTTKAAVIGLTKAVAADFITKGIRCNAICPGTVDTPSLQARLHSYGDYAKTRAEFEARQPVGRLGKPEEIAALALHLAGDELGFTTGQIHIIDGGWMT